MVDPAKECVYSQTGLGQIVPLILTKNVNMICTVFLIIANSYRMNAACLLLAVLRL